MFSKKETTNASAGVSYNNYDTLVGENTVIEGNISTKGTLRVDGKVNGNLQVEGDIVLGEKSKITGEINTQNIVVGGVIIGNVKASSSARLTPTGRVEGDLFVESLVVDEGAQFEGKCNMTKRVEQKSKVEEKSFGEKEKNKLPE